MRPEDAGPVVTDGPFVEGKEVVSGYAEDDVEDRDWRSNAGRWPGRCRTAGSPRSGWGFVGRWE